MSELQHQLDARLQFLRVTRQELRTDRPDTLAGPMLMLLVLASLPALLVTLAGLRLLF